MHSNILIVDDESFILKLMSSVFRDQDTVDVFTCKTSEEAKDIFNNKQIDLVITDIFLTGKDVKDKTNGLKLLEYFREQSDIPLIAISGNAEALLEAKHLGASETIVKPVANDYLNVLVNHMLKAYKTNSLSNQFKKK